MVCSRGKASPDNCTRKRLFADSGGYCQNPGCLRYLFETNQSRHTHIAEIAHVVAAHDAGPRADVEIEAVKRGAYENLIILCPACHTLVDKAPEEYPAALLYEWKRRHRERIDSAFGAARYDDRQAARRAVEPLLTQNREIHYSYGPDNDYVSNPESELANVWRSKVHSQILPNNQRILAILDANRGHLQDQELTTLERFRQHVDDMDARHRGDRAAAAGRRFPAEMHNIFLENGNA